ncbi:MAG: DUF389 domain-containing protein [Patescibacteria group bacterium]
MSFIYAPRSYSSESKQEAITDLLTNTVPDRDYYVLVIGAVALAVCAIFSDSLAVLIASMIVAPLAYPILALGFSAVVFDGRLFIRAFLLLLISLVVALLLAYLATYIFGHIRVDLLKISFSGNLYIATTVAVIAGAIAAYGLIRSKVGGAMTGIGIAVSLMPPLVATGIGAADADVAFAIQAFVLFLLNVLGIIVGSAGVFSLFGMRSEYRRRIR